jgi:hypothetical protein
MTDRMMVQMVAAAERRKQQAADDLREVVDGLCTLEAIEARIAPAALEGYYGVVIARDPFLTNAAIAEQRARIHAASDQRYSLATPGVCPGERVLLAFNVAVYHAELARMAVDNKLIDNVAHNALQLCWRVDDLGVRLESMGALVADQGERLTELYYTPGRPGAVAAIDRLQAACAEGVEEEPSGCREIPGGR